MKKNTPSYSQECHHFSDAADFEDYCCGNPAYPDSVRVVNAELQDCQPGEIGTIWVKSTFVCLHVCLPAYLSVSLPAFCLLICLSACM